MTQSMEWISVEDRLPDVNKTADEFETATVLVSWNGRVGVRHYCRRGSGNDADYYWGHPCSGRCADYGITHWMPLPKPSEV